METSIDLIQNLQRNSSPSAAHRVLREHIQQLVSYNYEFPKVLFPHLCMISIDIDYHPTLQMDTTHILDLALETAEDAERTQRPGDARTMINHFRIFRRREEEEFRRRKPIPDLGKALLPPAPCAFLRPGQRFSGMQQVTHWTPGKGEHWSVSVDLHQCDLQRGTLCGTMTAQNVPDASTPVVTFFHGEIIDNANASFYTAHADWNAVAEIDILHWTRFSSFLDLRSEVVRYGGRAPSLGDSDTVFMRWKEQFFVSGGECRLTIAGFYYVALNRLTGDILAFYFDPASSPDQRLKLTAQSGGEVGHSFSAREVA